MRGDLVHFIHTREFDECLVDLPMTDEELRDVQRRLQSNPEAGDAIPGTGGVRELRAAVKGKRKRGGAPQTTGIGWRCQAQSATQQERAGYCGSLGVR
jgi:hypothetical protein